MQPTEPRTIRIRCPHCAQVYEDQARFVPHPQAEDEETLYVQEGKLALCPHCRRTVAMDLLESGRDGVYSVADDR